MKTNIEILSWNKSRNECGFRLNLINHVDVFVQNHGVIFTVDENEKELYINVLEYADRYDYSKTPSEVIGKNETHVDKCQIIGNKRVMRQFQKMLGYSSIGNDASESQRYNDLCDTIDNLRHSISMLEYEIQNLNKDEVLS